ncbi:MAG: hypothetical protein JWN78_3335 [Bacteroidota bacterium]|nr:hypothetical protein [Bacteroidota bacterium]
MDGTPVFKFERIKIPFLLGYSNYFIKDLQDKKIAFAKYQSNYYELTFIESGLKAEIDMVYKPLALAKYLITYDLVQDGKITDESIEEFVLIIGQRFSQRYNGSSTIIINNTEPSPAPKNGVNISIGH